MESGEVIAFKFGGTSLAGADRMGHAAQLVRDAAEEAGVAVVVSAMKGVTDQLLRLDQMHKSGEFARATREADALLQLHRDVLGELRLPREEQERVEHDIQLLGRDLLHEIARRGGVEAERADRLASFGERFSVRLFAAALETAGVRAVPVASSDFVLTCDTFRDARPQLEETRRRGRELLLPLLDAGVVPVVTGFIGATADGRITTLGRNSSDYSGALVAHVVDADELVIWTDVDGIYTENPSEVAEAKLLHELSYAEAHALAEGGAKVLHPRVLPLAAETQMTVWVRNTFRPELNGTRIGPPASGAAEQTGGVA
ncbi:MAG: aspartate kinase [Acidobacteriia bacterium]|nr:aspartate kinase [Terriglobia bacterium]